MQDEVNVDAGDIGSYGRVIRVFCCGLSDLLGLCGMWVASIWGIVFKYYFIEFKYGEYSRRHIFYMIVVFITTMITYFISNCIQDNGNWYYKVTLEIAY